MQQARIDFLEALVGSAKEAVAEGYYSLEESANVPRRSLLRALRTCHGVPIIAELKFVSPAEGRLRNNEPVTNLASLYERGGAAAISVITERKHFGGDLKYLGEVKKATKLPVLMKDIFVDKEQLDAAVKLGADAVLLIARIFTRNLVDVTLTDMVRYAHEFGLEVLLEVHDEHEYDLALMTEVELVGINNRDLQNLSVSLSTSENILQTRKHSKPVVSESGFKSRDQILHLSSLGADGFLIGSVLMKSPDPVRLLRKLRGV